MSGEVHHKIILVGNSSVGKTSVIFQYLYNSCNLEQSPTVGIDYFTKLVQEGDKKITFQIWDTAGQEKFRSLIPSYIRNSSIAFLVYDITNRDSFESLQKWYQNIIDTANPHIIVVGNKVDLDPEREIPSDEGKKYADSINADFIETSAQTAVGVKELFEKAANLPAPVSNDTPSDNNQTTIKVVIDAPEPSQQSCFC